MKNIKTLIPYFLLLITCLVFFYQFFFLGKIPFPGDLLISNYNPWKAYSYIGYNPGSYPTKDQYFDTLRQIYPWKTFSINQLKNEQLPFWNPYNFSGSPLLANVQSAVFYPLNIFYFFISQPLAWAITVVLQPLLCSIFTYLFARKIKISPLASLLASVSFSYSLFAAVFLEYNTINHVILWLPLSLFCIEHLLDKLRVRYLLLFVISIVFSFFAGHLQVFGFNILFIIIYSLVRIHQQNLSRSQKIKKGFLIGTLILLSLGISAVQLLPTLELLSVSARVNQPYQFLVEKLLIQPYQLVLLLSPDFFGNPVTRNFILPESYPGNAMYIGLIPFLLVPFALVQFKKNKIVQVFTYFIIVLFIFIVRTPISEVFYQLNLPFLSTGSPSNAIYLLSFCLSMLSAIGLDLWIQKKQTKTVWLLVIFGFVFVVVWRFIGLNHMQVAIKNFAYSTVILGAFVFLILSGTFLKIKRIFIAALFIGITIGDLGYFFLKFNSFVPQELVFPKTEIFSYFQKKSSFDRIWGYGSAGVEANFTTQYSLFSPDGYDPLYPKRYGEFIQSSKEGKIAKDFTNQTRSDAIIAPGYGETDLSSNEYRLRVLDLLGVKYIVAKKEDASEITFPLDRFKQIYTSDQFVVFENQKALPRVFLVSNYQVYTSKKEFADVFLSPSFDSASTILLEQPIPHFKPLIPPTTSTSPTSHITSYTPSKITIQTKSRNNAFLFLSDVYYPGWKAYVDSKKTQIYPADYAFRSVVVPSGDHSVIFQYQPESFKSGVYVLLASLAVAIVLIIGIQYKKTTYE